MRIAFCGASGTGKSTLAEYVAKKYSLPMNPVGSRSVSKAMGFDSPYDVDKVGRRAEFQRRLVTDKCAWEASHEAFVTDRTTLDNLAYTILHDVHAVDDKLIEEVATGLSRYTHVFLCSIEAFFHPGADPMRVKSVRYHEIYDLVLEGLLRRYAHVLPTGGYDSVPYDDRSRTEILDALLRGESEIP